MSVKAVSWFRIILFYNSHMWWYCYICCCCRFVVFLRLFMMSGIFFLSLFYLNSPFKVLHCACDSVCVCVCAFVCVCSCVCIGGGEEGRGGCVCENNHIQWHCNVTLILDVRIVTSAYWLQWPPWGPSALQSIAFGSRLSQSSVWHDCPQGIRHDRVYQMTLDYLSQVVGVMILKTIDHSVTEHSKWHWTVTLKWSMWPSIGQLSWQSVPFGMGLSCSSGQCDSLEDAWCDRV